MGRDGGEEAFEACAPKPNKPARLACLLALLLMSASPPSPSFRDYLPEDGNGSESALRRTQQIANPPPAGFGSVRDNSNSNKNSMNSAMKSSHTRPREER